MGAFGEKLRKQREQRGIALDTISNTTKISTRMLRAIEEEHFDQLPGGVFNKGFVRAYARHVGLNEEEAVTDYLNALRESQIQAQTVPPNFRAQPAKPAPESHEPGFRNPAPAPNALPGDDLRRNNRHKADSRRRNLPQNKKEEKKLPEVENSVLRELILKSEDPAPGAQPNSSEPAAPPYDAAALVPWGKLAAGLLMLTLVLALWSLHRRGQSAPNSQATAASLPSPTSVQASAPVQVPVQPSASSTSLTGGKALTTGTLTAGTRSNLSPAPTLADAARKPSPAASMKSSTTKPAAVSESSESNGNPSRAQSSTQALAPNAAPTFTLQIRATETSWVSITADGQPVLHETLIAPAQTSIRATREIIVRAGNSAGITFALNGKEIPPSGDESEGEVRIYTFDSTRLKTSVLATPNPSPTP